MAAERARTNLPLRLHNQQLMPCCLRVLGTREPWRICRPSEARRPLQQRLLLLLQPRRKIKRIILVQKNRRPLRKRLLLPRRPRRKMKRNLLVQKRRGLRQRSPLLPVVSMIVYPAAATRSSRRWRRLSQATQVLIWDSDLGAFYACANLCEELLQVLVGYCFEAHPSKTLCRPTVSR